MKELQNTINKKQVESESPAPEKQAAKVKPGPGPVKTILEGAFLARERIIRQLPFFLFLTGIGLVYIFNSNYSNHTIISISKTKKQIEEQRFEYINTNSKLMVTTRQSEIAKKLANSGLKESKTPPRKIVIYQNKQ